MSATTTWAVTMENVVSTTITVEADTADEAMDKAAAQGVPTLMFIDYTYPEEGDWEAVCAWALED